MASTPIRPIPFALELLDFDDKTEFDDTAAEEEVLGRGEGEVPPSYKGCEVQNQAAW